MTSSTSIEVAHPTRKVDVRFLRKLIRQVAKEEGFRINNLSVVLADHELVLELNRTYLSHHYLTDVIAFNFVESAQERIIDGEIYVDLDTAEERHSEFNVTFEEEVRRYVVHGLLHLMGYVDDQPEGKEQMHSLEDRYLSSIH